MFRCFASRLIHIPLITHSVAPLFLFLLPFVTTTGKTTPTSASTTYHVAAFPKEAGDPDRGTGPDAPPPVGEQGSPDSEPISVEMEGKGEGFYVLSEPARGLHCWALNASSYASNRADH
ncbi:hypothetical protein NQZ68_026172 [Dissostichus eleginoides]|nr:hypothetical protein NQZ68_026172 [Dissostichus eleginoides]